MTGSKMEDDGNEGGHDARQYAALVVSPRNNDILMVTHTQDTQFHPDKGAVVASQECPDKPHVAPQPSSDGNPGEQGSIRPPGINSIAELCEIQCTSEVTAGLNLYPKSPCSSATFEERSFETKVDDREREGLKNGLTGAELFADDGSKLGDGVREMQLPSNNQMEEDELSNGMNKRELPPGSDTKEKDSNNGITELELAVKNKPKEDALDNVSIKIQLPTQGEIKEGLNNGLTEIKVPPENKAKEEELHNVAMERRMPSKNAKKVELLNHMVSGKELLNLELDQGHEVDAKAPSRSFFLEPDAVDGDETGTKMEQAAFMKDLEKFHKERCLDFKPPRFYGEPLNCLKLWRAVIRLGGYEQVTSCKLWRQVGESFNPPKTCTTVSWTFRCFYEKALLEYEKQKMRSGELPFTDASFTEHDNVSNQMGLNQPSGSGRARRDAAARAMQGWHSQRLLGNGEVGDPIIKDKNSISLLKRDKQLKNIGLLKHKRPSVVERAVKVARIRASKPQLESMVVDIGPSAEWVKINVQKTKDCFEVYALVPGLLREEVRVQSDPAGRLVISGLPEHLDNPWGVAPFKKVVSLPSRIDPHQTSAVVTLHGQLFVRVPFEQSDA